MNTVELTKDLAVEIAGIDSVLPCFDKLETFRNRIITVCAPYMHHKPECDLWVSKKKTPAPVCTCGMDEILKSGSKP
jgi:hypothetical protein